MSLLSIDDDNNDDDEDMDTFLSQKRWANFYIKKRKLIFPWIKGNIFFSNKSFMLTSIFSTKILIIDDSR